MNETLQPSYIRVINNRAFRVFARTQITSFDDHLRLANEKQDFSIRVLKTLVQRFRYDLKWYSL